MVTDTIAAVSTAVGEAAISIIRLSGPQALEIGSRVLHTRRALADLPPRVVHLAEARDAEGLILDQGIVILFHSPASYTGEPTLEFQGHGGILVTQRVLEAFLKAGARHAEPG